MKEQSETFGAMDESDRRFYEIYGDGNGKLNWEKFRNACANATPIAHEEFLRQIAEAGEKYRNAKGN